MANSLYAKGRNHFAFGDIVWKAAGGSTIRAFLIDNTAYTPDLVNDEFLSSVAAGARKGGTGTAYNQGVQLTLVDAAAGVCDAADVTFSAVVAGNPCQYILLYKQGTGDADSILIVLIDTATGLPVTPNGGDVLAQWDNGSNKIFML